MDAAAKATWRYLRRPPQSDPPRHPAGSPLLLLLWLLLWLLPLLRLRRVQGAALLRTPPSCTMGPTPPGHRP
ncbi:hypothetical protein EKL94_07880 [Stenotrophomonas maltophilia]|uniref:Transmembrane protein n=1 Tax=Stenotrophomonas maltophilia TaxID=40324 RepID=A0A3S0KFJ1_STEMA|nr:hypothetical protein EKL94_07880 [Stenotrophomonas maltophilia]